MPPAAELNQGPTLHDPYRADKGAHVHVSRWALCPCHLAWFFYVSSALTGGSHTLDSRLIRHHYELPIICQKVVVFAI
jgi:hypothetical protein